MNKIINKINIQKLIIIFLLIQPIVDLITSICVRYFQISTTIGVIVKGVFLIFIILFIFLKYKFIERKASTIFILALILYELCYIFINLTNKSYSILFLELKSSLKTLFGPILAISLYDIFRNENFNIKSRYLSYVMIEYVILIFIANLTGTGFNTYLGGKEGTIGWFYAGNDISNLLIGLYPILCFFAIKNSKILPILSLFLSTYVLLFIGTKVALFGVVLTIVSIFILSIVNYFLKKDKFKLKKTLLIITLLIVFTSLLIPFSPSIKNIRLQYNENMHNNENTDVLDDMVFSGRSGFKKNSTFNFYKSSNINKWFGQGYYDSSGNEYKLVEIDYYDILFNHGIVGLIMIFSIYIYIFIKIITLIFKRTIKSNFRLNIESHVISLILLLGISLYAGHIFLNPAVNLYLAVILVNIYYKKYFQNNFKKVKNNKITFMALHLKYGGIEKFIATTSKFLSNDYEVEIVSVYKYPNSEIEKIDKNVKVKYLLNENQLPNKDKINLNLKQRKLILTLRELLFAIKIVVLKNIKMINYIKECDSDIIISTRAEHNYILSEYGSNKSLKIATEHNYYSNKYSKKVLNSCSDIDYFIVSTNDQKNYYKKLFMGNKLKVIKIPFAIENIPKDSSKLNNYNLVTVGRLSSEKGYLDLIEIFNLISKKNSKYTLTIVGEGLERKKIEEKIKNYGLNKKIKLVGAKDSKDIQKILLNSSLFLMTSYTESFGIVLIEAMSCGLPCIIFDSAKGALELIKNNYNGYIIKNRNINLYANKILKVFQDRDTLINMGNNSKEFVSKFNIETIKNEWLNILK